MKLSSCKQFSYTLLPNKLITVPANDITMFENSRDFGFDKNVEELS